MGENRMGPVECIAFMLMKNENVPWYVGAYLTSFFQRPVLR